MADEWKDCIDDWREDIAYHKAHPQKGGNIMWIQPSLIEQLLDRIEELERPTPSAGEKP